MISSFRFNGRVSLSQHWLTVHKNFVTMQLPLKYFATRGTALVTFHIPFVIYGAILAENIAFHGVFISTSVSYNTSKLHVIKLLTIETNDKNKNYT